MTEYYRCNDCNFKWSNTKKVIYLILNNINVLEMYFKDVISCRKCSYINDVLLDIGNQIFIDCYLTRTSIMDLPVQLY